MTAWQRELAVFQTAYGSVGLKQSGNADLENKWPNGQDGVCGRSTNNDDDHELKQVTPECHDLP